MEKQPLFTRLAAILTLSIVVVVLSGLSIFADRAPAAPSRPVTQPIAERHAWVDPNVGQEMNGPKEKVTLASKVHMHKAPSVPDTLTGDGQGNGCLKGYGEPGQCLPVLSPAQQAMPTMEHPWTCADVRTLFPQGIKVTGRDTLGLDSNGDHTACDPGEG